MRSGCLALLAALSASAFAQFTNPLIIPPTLDEDTFDLVVDEHVHQFYPGVNTPTFGVNGDYFGPTLIFHKGDTVRIRLHNQLDTLVTNMHWHGMQLPGEMDGGPPRQVEPGEVWNVKYLVKNLAATYWYHPHPHQMTARQTNMGIAGFIIVRDDEEGALDLPRTYGVDDFPIAIQDRRYEPDGSFHFGPFGDSVLVNGTPNAYLNCPAQVVRLRLLNASNARFYRLGFDDGRQFSIIGSDGGLLSAPATMDRLMLSNAERYEMLLDLTGMEGDSLLLMSYAAELPEQIPGAANSLWENSSLSGVNFPLLRIRVTAQTPDPVTAIPASLVNVVPPNEADVSRQRIKSMGGFGDPGMSMYDINELMFDINVINDTVMLGATERWIIENATDIAHPFHIHGVSFYITERNSLPPPAWETGPKDVVFMDQGDAVKLIMKFDDKSNGWPFMYHCHNLFHEDDMLMLQYIVVDSSALIHAQDNGSVTIGPSPTRSIVSYACDFDVHEITLTDMLGRTVLHTLLHQQAQDHQHDGHHGGGQPADQKKGSFDMSALPGGAYALQLQGDGRSARSVVVRE